MHAVGQIIHFDSQTSRPLRAWERGVNTLLPDDISVRWAKTVDSSFHARFSATSRRYRYLILNRDTRPAIAPSSVTWVREHLDAALMHDEAQVLLGEHDFSSFRAAGCQSKTAMRNVQEISVQRSGQLVIIEIRANAFLYHMVRNIAGVLIAVGRGDKQPGWTLEVLQAKNRCDGGVTARASGLYLVDVEYPVEFGLPRIPLGPWFLESADLSGSSGTGTPSLEG